MATQQESFTRNKTNFLKHLVLFGIALPGHLIWKILTTLALYSEGCVKKN